MKYQTTKWISPQIEQKEDPQDDPRIGQLLQKPQIKTKPQVVIIGFPSDLGVKINQGRVGAAHGPNAIRQALYNLTPHPINQNHRALLQKTQDLGDLSLSEDLSQNQATLGQIIAPYLQNKITPIILGGGHETAFGHFLAYAFNKQPMQIINIDAHTDVRPLKNNNPHSGSPFYQALEHPSKVCKNYHVAGLQPSAVAQKHLAYLGEKQSHITWIDQLRDAAPALLFQNLKHDTMLTLDLDVVDRSAAPGVSAPCTHGLSADQFLKIAYHAGQNTKVKSIDLVELNPRYDQDNQSAKLCALALWYFLLGRSEAKTNS